MSHLGSSLYFACSAIEILPQLICLGALETLLCDCAFFLKDFRLDLGSGTKKVDLVTFQAVLQILPSKNWLLRFLLRKLYRKLANSFGKILIPRQKKTALQ